MRRNQLCKRIGWSGMQNMKQKSFPGKSLVRKKWSDQAEETMGDYLCGQVEIDQNASIKKVHQHILIVVKLCFWCMYDAWNFHFNLVYFSKGASLVEEERRLQGERKRQHWDGLHVLWMRQRVDWGERKQWKCGFIASILSSRLKSIWRLVWHSTIIIIVSQISSSKSCLRSQVQLRANLYQRSRCAAQTR